ncbi:zf-HC2 domain-containing protein [soil metagenome]
MTGDDRFSDWDAAYVLGALSPADRREYELHLASCDGCRAAVGDLVGMPGLLSRIPRDEAVALGDGVAAPDGTNETTDAPPDLLPHLLSRARRRRLRTRLVGLGAGLAAVGAAVAVTLAVSLPAASTSVTTPVTSGVPGGGAVAEQVQLTNEVPGPLTAVASFTAETWGTRIDWSCTYETGPGATGGAPSGRPDGGTPDQTTAHNPSDGYASTYAMVVTDTHGTRTQVATWSAAPGTVVTPTATTSIHLADIASVTIVAADTGQVLLRSSV